MKYYGDTMVDKDVVMELIKSEKPKVIVELGCSCGADTADFLRRMNYNDMIISVEADPRVVKNFAIRDPRLFLVHAAISDENKDNGIFHICTGIFPQTGNIHSDASSVKHLTPKTYDVNPWMQYSDVRVPYITLDTLCEKLSINNIDFIWCDVEGNTAETIRGGLNSLKNTKYFYTEITESIEHGYEGDLLYTDLVKLMKSINFELVHKFPHDALFKNKELTKL